MLGEGGALYEPKQIELDEAVSHLLSLRHQLANLQVAVLEGASSARKSIINELQNKEKKLREQKQQTQITSKRELSQRDAILSEIESS